MTAKRDETTRENHSLFGLRASAHLEPMIKSISLWRIIRLIKRHLLIDASGKTSREIKRECNSQTRERAERNYRALTFTSFRKVRFSCKTSAR